MFTFITGYFPITANIRPLTFKASSSFSILESIDPVIIITSYFFLGGINGITFLLIIKYLSKKSFWQLIVNIDIKKKKKKV